MSAVPGPMNTEAAKLFQQLASLIGVDVAPGTFPGAAPALSVVRDVRPATLTPDVEPPTATVTELPVQRDEKAGETPESSAPRRKKAPTVSTVGSLLARVHEQPEPIEKSPAWTLADAMDAPGTAFKTAEEKNGRVKTGERFRGINENSLTRRMSDKRRRLPERIELAAQLYANTSGHARFKKGHLGQLVGERDRNNLQGGIRDGIRDGRFMAGSGALCIVLPDDVMARLDHPDTARAGSGCDYCADKASKRKGKNAGNEFTEEIK